MSSPVVATMRRRPLFVISRRDPEPEPLQHKFSSTQVEIVGRPAETMKKMSAAISDADLNAEEGSSYGGASVPDGREHDPHVTVKYGVHFQTPSRRLRDALRRFGPVTITFGKTSLFQNEDADVLKVDIVSPDLRRLNNLIARLLPTDDTHPIYSPHATIAYLKPGRGKKYAGNTALSGQMQRFDSIVFSGKRGHREVLPLTGDR